MNRCIAGTSLSYTHTHTLSVSLSLSLSLSYFRYIKQIFPEAKASYESIMLLVM